MSTKLSVLYCGSFRPAQQYVEMKSTDFSAMYKTSTEEEVAAPDETEEEESPADQEEEAASVQGKLGDFKSDAKSAIYSLMETVDVAQFLLDESTNDNWSPSILILS